MHLIFLSPNDKLPFPFTGLYKSKSGNEIHYVNNVIHNDSGPAVTVHDKSCKYWIVNGKIHREDGPAIELNFTIYDTNVGTLVSIKPEYWFINDKLIGSSGDGYTQEKFEEWKRFKVFI